MTQRALFVCSAKAVPALDHGAMDCQKIVETLTNHRFGGSNVIMPVPPLLECASSRDFLGALGEFVDATPDVTQRIFYFTGHGRWDRHQFAFEFDGSKHLSFSVAAGVLEPSAHRRTLFILDSCYSGAAGSSGYKSAETFPVGAGSCVLSSCKDIELSREVAEHGSLFTHYFCEGIKTGLDGIKTSEGRISVTDILRYVSRKLEMHKAAGLTQQTPTYSVLQSEGPFWIATNVSGSVEEALAGAVPSLDSDTQALSPIGATFADLDEAAILAFAERDGFSHPNALAAAHNLGMLTTHEDGRPSAAAILCFGKAPQRFFPDVASVFSAGDKAGSELVSHQIEGNLLNQFERLLELLLRHLDRRSTFAETGLRSDQYEIDPQVLREVVANALTHRNFAGRGRVQVHVDEDHIEVMNPGGFPEGYDWEALLDRPGKSLTENRRVANFLNKLGTVEGLGRGFHILKAFRTRRGESSIRFEQTGGVVACYIRREARQPANHVPTVEQAFEGETQKQLAKALDLQMLAIADTQILGMPYSLRDVFVPPLVQDENRQNLTYADLIHRLWSSPRYTAVLTAAGGMGKTMLLRKLALDLNDLSKRALQPDGRADVGFAPANSDSAPLVMYVALRSLSTDHKLIASIAQVLGTFPTALDQALRRRRAILLLDGFDEIAPAQRAASGHSISRLAAEYPDMAILLSSRVSEGLFTALPDADDFTLQPFSREQALQMTDISGSGMLTTMIRGLPDDSPLIANPLLIHIAALSFENSGIVSDLRQPAVRQYVQYMLHQHDASKSQFNRVMTLGSDAMEEVIRSTALIMFLNSAFEIDEFTAHRYVGLALKSLGLDAEHSYTTQILKEILELGFFLQRDGKNIFAVHRAIFDQLAITGAARVIRTPERFATLLIILMRHAHTLKLAGDFFQEWSKGRADTEMVLDALRQEIKNEPAPVAARLEGLIGDLAERLPTHKAPPDELFDLLDDGPR